MSERRKLETMLHDAGEHLSQAKALLSEAAEYMGGYHNFLREENWELYKELVDDDIDTVQILAEKYNSVDVK